MNYHNSATPIKILLVEDSPSDAELAMETLGTSKFLTNLDVVEDGVQALDYLYQRGEYANTPRPDMILLDLNLPKKSGLEVLAEIKSDPDLTMIPVVVLTTSAADEDIIASYSLYANCYITKPVDFHQFTNLVKLIENFWLTVAKLPSD